MANKILLLVAALSLGACVTFSDENKPPPEITEEMTTDEAIDHGLEFGDRTLKDAKKLVGKRNEVSKCAETMRQQILRHHGSWSNARLINALNLYQSCDPKDSDVVFHALINSNRPLAHQLGWHLAAGMPSARMRVAIDNRLTEVITHNDMEDLFIPAMAEAVTNNRLTSSYTLMRQGLFETNHVAFVNAMSSLDPKRASGDFMDYLGLAPVEELRQLNMRTLDLVSCTAILQHMQVHPVAVSHPRFEHLFFFAISRNNALAEMARNLLESYLPDNSQHLALVLAAMPGWVQVAFVEGARRKMTALVGLFLTELKKVTAQNEVVDEINNLHR